MNRLFESQNNSGFNMTRFFPPCLIIPRHDLNHVIVKGVFSDIDNASKQEYFYLDSIHKISAQLYSVGCSSIFCWSFSSGVACLGACHPSPCSADDNSESLHGRPGDWAVDPILPEGWCYWPSHR